MDGWIRNYNGPDVVRLAADQLEKSISALRLDTEMGQHVT